MEYRYMKLSDALAPGRIVIMGVSKFEPMRPCIVDRPDGTGDRLLMLFHDPVWIEFQGRRELHPAGILRLWKKAAGHYYGNREREWSHSWLHFHGKDVPGLFTETGLPEDFCIPCPKPKTVERYLDLFYAEVSSGGSPSAALLRDHLHSLFLEIRRMKDSSEEVPEIPEKWQDVRDFIENRAEQELNLKQLARNIYLSVPAFLTGFRKHFGMSPIQFQLSCRMERARYLLRNRDLGVKEVGAQCGYGDLFQFSRMFRRKTGMSPSEFRKLLPGKNHAGARKPALFE